MSADNWTICPRCMKMAVEEKDKQNKQAAESYGKVSEVEYTEILEKARADINMEQTLREDYEFYMEDDGTFTADYRAHCDRCGFKYEFKHEEEVAV